MRGHFTTRPRSSKIGFGSELAGGLVAGPLRSFRGQIFSRDRPCARLASWPVLADSNSGREDRGIVWTCATPRLRWFVQCSKKRLRTLPVQLENQKSKQVNGEG